MMKPDPTLINSIGALGFGSVIGWCIYYSMRRWKRYSPSQLGVLITAILGSVSVSFFAGAFSAGAYGIGIALGFFSFAFWAYRHGFSIYLIEDIEDGEGTTDFGEEVPPDTSDTSN